MSEVKEVALEVGEAVLGAVRLGEVMNDSRGAVYVTPVREFARESERGRKRDRETRRDRGRQIHTARQRTRRGGRRQIQTDTEGGRQTDKQVHRQLRHLAHIRTTRMSKLPSRPHEGLGERFCLLRLLHSLSSFQQDGGAGDLSGDIYVIRSGYCLNNNNGLHVT